MKKLALLILFAGATILGLDAQPDSGEAEKTRASILMLHAPAIPADLVARMSGWIEKWYGIPVERREEEGLREGLPADFAASELSQKTGAGRLVLLVCDSCGADGKEGESVRRLTPCVSALNLAALRGVQKGRSGEQQLFDERVDREALRAVAGLLELPACLLPLCALSTHRTLDQLDGKGRGLCPPCSIRAAEHVNRLGPPAAAKKGRP